MSLVYFDAIFRIYSVDFSTNREKKTELTKVIECHEIKAEVISSANQRRGSYLKEPIRIQRRKKQTAKIAGTREGTSHDWV